MGSQRVGHDWATFTFASLRRVSKTHREGHPWMWGSGRAVVPWESILKGEGTCGRERGGDCGSDRMSSQHSCSPRLAPPSSRKIQPWVPGLCSIPDCSLSWNQPRVWAWGYGSRWPPSSRSWAWLNLQPCQPWWPGHFWPCFSGLGQLCHRPLTNRDVSGFDQGCLAMKPQTSVFTAQWIPNISTTGYCLWQCFWGCRGQGGALTSN